MIYRGIGEQRATEKDMRAALEAASAVAEREAAPDELTAQAQEYDMGYGKEADMIDEFKLSEAKIAIAREEDTIRRLLERVAEALEPFYGAITKSEMVYGDSALDDWTLKDTTPAQDLRFIDLRRARLVLADVRKALEMMK